MMRGKKTGSVEMRSDQKMQHGVLVCVGCGIKGIAHITLEAAAWIARADVVCHCCSDPATVIWIRAQARRTCDLAACYSEQTDRAQIYRSMIDIIMSEVRQDQVVCVVFYGHPGVFVYPTHAAIATARAEGHAAFMLPGISAEDCLYADLGVDPSQAGCVAYEATDLLLHRRHVSTDSHLIVWQIGVIGQPGFRFRGYKDNRVEPLIRYLEEHYSLGHIVCHYQAAQFMVCRPVAQWVPLGQLATCSISAISTLYVPPAHKRKCDAELGEALGYLEQRGDSVTLAVPKRSAAPEQRYCPPPEQSALADFLNNMAADPDLLARFLSAPHAVRTLDGKLNECEADAVATREPSRIRAAIRA